MIELGDEFLRAVKAEWKEEIERTIDRGKNAGKRTPLDRWFRKQFYRAKWRMRNVKGARVERD